VPSSTRFATVDAGTVDVASDGCVSGSLAAVPGSDGVVSEGWVSEVLAAVSGAVGVASDGCVVVAASELDWGTVGVASVGCVTGLWVWAVGASRVQAVAVRRMTRATAMERAGAGVVSRGRDIV
jgi:hypothetical protein